MPNEKEIEMERIITIRGSLTGVAGNSEQEQEIHVEFTPDEMIIDSFAYYSGYPIFYPLQADIPYPPGTLPSSIVGELFFSLVNEKILIFTDSPTVYYPNRKFKIGFKVQGFYFLSFRTLNNTPYNGTAARTENYTINLRFVKYKK